MPSPQTVLITGASGFVGAHLVRVFLEAGYKVRATIRSASSASSITAAQGSLSSELEFAIVPDLQAPGAFDEALKGVSGVIHCASPFVLEPKDNEEDILRPAINMTINVLAAATSHPSVKRVIVTSSFAAMLDLAFGYRPGYIYSEADWNPVSYEEAAASSNGSFAYCASKKLAEKAAWDFMAEKRPSFSLSTICPPWIFGPSLTSINLSNLNESTEAIYKLITSSSSAAMFPTDFGGFADVRDVAAAHLAAYEKEQAAGKRFLVGQHFEYQSAADAIRNDFSELKSRVPQGTFGAGKTAELYVLDGSEAEKVLGIKYTPLEISMRDTVQALLDAENKVVA